MRKFGKRLLPRYSLVWVMALALGACQSGSSQFKDSAPLQQPDDQLIANTMAGAAERAGDLAGAQQYYGRIIAEGKGTRHTFERRGELLLTLGAPQEAGTVFAQALQAGFDSVDIRRGYGRALAWLGQGEAALAQYDAALARNPGDIRSMNGRGVALDMLGRHEQAQAQYSAAMAAAPADLAVQNNMAMSLALAGKVAEAVAILERINSSGVATVQHRQNLALLYGLLGRVDQAAELARRDLPADAAARNLAAYATLQHLYEGSRAPEIAAAPTKPVASAPLPPTPSAVAEPGPAASAPAARVPLDGTPVTATPVTATTASAAVPQPAVAPPIRQPWVVDLGLFESEAGARDAWARLKQSGNERFAQVVHYLEAEGSSKRLLAGPFWGEDAARGACDVVRAQTMQCTARQASAVRSGTAAPTTATPGDNGAAGASSTQ